MTLYPSLKSRALSCGLALCLALPGLSARAESPDTTRSPAPAAPPSHPVAAEVNGVKILRQEVEYLYGRSPAPAALPPEAVAGRKRTILSQLVRAEVLAQKAVADKLDRQPEFEVEMAIARRAALAAKVDRQFAGGAAQVTAQQALDYVNTNPNLFAQRQLLTLEVMSLKSPDAGLIDQLGQAVDKGAGLDRLERQVREARGESHRRVVQAPSESLPPDLLKALLAQPYRPAIVRLPGNEQLGNVLLVRSATPAPLVGREAVRAAGRLLQSRQFQSASSSGAQGLLGAAKVAYYGEYVGIMASADTGLDAALGVGQAYRQPVSRLRQVALAGALAAALALLVLLGVAGRRYWVHGVDLAAAGGWKLFGLGWRRQPQPHDALARAMAESDALFMDPDTRASWLGKLLLLAGLAGCVGLLLLQAQGAWSRLPYWVLAVAVVAGALAGVGLGLIWMRSRLRALGLQRRWLGPLLLGGLLAAVSGFGIVWA